VINAEWIYWLLGGTFVSTGLQIARDVAHPRRWSSALFWTLLGLSMAYSSFIPALPAWPLGIAVIAIALIGGSGRVLRGTVPTTTDTQREASAALLRDRLFAPSFVIPVITALVALAGARLTIAGKLAIAPGQATLVGLGIAAIAAMITAFVIIRPQRPSVAFVEGRRLLESIGWAALLPQMLATLGLLFTQAGVGTQIGLIFHAAIPAHSRVLVVIVYALGMFAFTVIMGNAFAAFPIMTAAIGWPVLVVQMHAHPAPLFAIGMLAGFCGTLCTPMAAIFNLVPPMLLEMRDRYGQIKVQLPTAAALLLVNITFMVIFPFLW
jgi:uncharacterized membrane protein